jgi:micrococcal nuclease
MVRRPLTAMALALSLALASGAQAQTVSGRAHVLDGDTIEVGGVRVRLEGLHCPEGNDPGGSAATSAMRGLTAGASTSAAR